MATTPVVFLKEVRDELQKVVWPTRDEIIRLTGVVILVSVGVGIFLGATDFILTKLVGLLITKR
jgi:preprotein translocase subunit SecE